MNNKRFAGCLTASLFATIVAFGTFLLYGENWRFLTIVMVYNESTNVSVKSNTWFIEPSPKPAPLYTSIQSNTRKHESSRTFSSTSNIALTKNFRSKASRTAVRTSSPITTKTARVTTRRSTLPTVKISTRSTPRPKFSTVRTTTTSRPRHFVCPTFMGRLGNNLFQFASGFGIAYSKNMTFVIGERDLINSIFELKNNEHLLISKDKKMCTHARVRGENRGCAYDPNVLNFQPDGTYRPANYLQSWKYFDSASKELKKQLVFREPIRTQVKKIMDDLVQKYNLKSRKDATFVAIHVRRGDMVNHGFGYMVATRGYFDLAMQIFKNYSNVIFLICSNDMAWSKANIVGNYKKEFVIGNRPEVDIALMASCDHMIMSVGSYSWWAGWLGSGKKVYFKWPAREGSGLRAQFSKDYMDYFYPQWIGL